MKRGDIVYVQLPRAVGQSGHEQFGTRPALVIHSNDSYDTLSVVMIVPFTSQSTTMHFPHTILVQPSTENGLKVPSFLLIFQLRAIDKKRITRKIGRLEPEIMEQVEVELKKLLQL